MGVRLKKSYKNFQLFFVQIKYVLTLMVEKKIERISQDKKISCNQKNWVREVLFILLHQL